MNNKLNSWKNPAVWMLFVLVIVGACKDDPEPEKIGPKAAFLVSDLTPGLDEEITFTDQSTDADGEIVERSWDFGNGSSSDETSPKKSYATEGTYTVKLTVTDNHGLTSVSTASVVVTDKNLAPVAKFAVAIQDRNTDLLVVVMPDSVIAFRDGSSDTDGTIVSWHWDLGDGTTVTTQNIESHSYATGGTYPVKLTVTDEKGATNEITKKIYVPKVKWTYPVNGMESGSPAVDDAGNVYLGDRGGVVYKLNKDDGTALWSFSAGVQIRSSVVISDDNSTVYVGSNGKKFYAINANDGTQKWAVSLTGNVDKSSASLDPNGNVYFGTADGKLYSLKTSDGTQNWIFDAGLAKGDIESSPLFTNGKVIVAIGNTLYSVNAATGEKAWEYTLQADRYEGYFAINDNGILFAGAENTTTKSGRIYAINVSTGIEVWSKSVPGEVRANSPILGPDGTLYVSTEDGVDEQSMALYALNSTNGSQIWVSTVAKDDYKVAGTLGKSGIIYIGSNDDSFYMVNSKDGSLICKFSNEKADHSTPPVIGADGTVYYGSRGSLFYAMTILDSGEEGLPTTGWPIVGGNAKHTGRK